MQVKISGQKITIGNSLQRYVENKLQTTVQRYFEHATSTHVNFTKESFEFLCNIIVYEGSKRDIVIKSSDKSDDVYVSFDLALVKLEKQLRKYKERLKDRHERIKASRLTKDSVKYVLSPIGMIEETQEQPQEESDNPVIIAEKPTQIMSLSVRDAVMKMDLEDLPTLLFENSKTGRINVVYYRKDGNISWIDTTPEQ